MQEIINFRRKLHQNPELSGQEYATQKRIIEFVSKFNPDEIVTIAKTGIAVIYKGMNKGKTLVFRADIDALPIQEQNSKINYGSINKGVAHLCGHDGHTAILLALAKHLSINKPKSGRVVLLFQPAEETGQGAKAVLNDEHFQKLNPDYVFGFHNLPGFEKNTLFVKKGIFAAASCGLIVHLLGKTAHAAEPEKGINPANAIASFIQFIKEEFNDKKHYKDLAFATIVHINVGEVAFGTSPGEAKLMVTLRAFEDRDMDKMHKMFHEKLDTLCRSEKLFYKINKVEEFPALINDATLFEQINYKADKSGLALKVLDKSFRWSEDFAFYSKKYPVFYFGIGAGNIPNLHSVDYDFQDDIIGSVTGFLEDIIKYFE